MGEQRFTQKNGVQERTNLPLFGLTSLSPLLTRTAKISGEQEQSRAFVYPPRQIISTPTFVKHFGDPTPTDGKGDVAERERTSIFGREDELKVAPKGIPKDHKYVLTFPKDRALTYIHLC